MSSPPRGSVRWAAIACLLLSLAAPVRATEPPQSPHQGSPDGDATKSFVFVNLRNYFLPAEDGSHNPERPPKPEKEIGCIIEELRRESPDFVGFAEIGGAREADDLWRRLAGCGLDYPHRVLLEAADENRMLAFFSRLPVAEDASVAHVGFELGGRKHAMQRGILDVAVLRPSGGKTRFIGVHLKSKREVAAFDQAEFRAREARGVRKHLEAAASAEPDSEFLVWGDFNSLKNEAPLREVLSASGAALRVLEIADSRGEVWTHHWREADLYSRIDFLLVSRALFSKVVREKTGILDSPAWREATDHRPIKATFRWN